MHWLRGRRGFLGALAVWAAALLSAGCSPKGRITLHQPHAPPAQQRLHLSSGWAFTNLTGETREVLLDFPLPGRKEGPRDFRFYLQMPAASGVHTLSRGDEGAARGFFIQEVGRLRGKTDLVRGTVRVRSAPTAPRLLRIDLDAECDDGTRVTGTATVMASGEELRSFTRRYAADVAALRAAQPEASDEQAPTASRPSGEP